MAAKKTMKGTSKKTYSKTTKTSTKSTVRHTEPAVTNNDLYICLHDAVNKRKLLLLALKNSLIVQEEYEKIIELRSTKKEILMEIKSNIDTVNSKYQEVKKILPNVKNVLSYTQKELTELESQIDSIKSSMKHEEQILEDEKELEKELKKTLKSEPKKQTAEELLPRTNTDPSISKTPKVVKRTTKKPVTKIDRIKNNLSLIEQKLKGL